MVSSGQQWGWSQQRLLGSVRINRLPTWSPSASQSHRPGASWSPSSLPSRLPHSPLGRGSWLCGLLPTAGQRTCLSGQSGRGWPQRQPHSLRVSAWCTGGGWRPLFRKPGPGAVGRGQDMASEIGDTWPRLAASTQSLGRSVAQRQCVVVAAGATP